jgi:hypothetical protein
MTNDPDVRSARDPEADLERALIDEYLHSLGHDERSVESLPAAERRHLLEAASTYAAGKLAEIQARAHFVEGLHHQE